MGDINNTLLENSKSTPLGLSALIGSSDRYITSNEISKLAIKKYETKSGRGITYADLLEVGLAEHKARSRYAQVPQEKRTLFSLEPLRPQQYYATAIKSDIMKNLQKSTPIDPTGVAINNERPISKHSL